MLEASPSYTTTVLVEPPADPSSLRALALSTLKSKRKRPAAAHQERPLQPFTRPVAVKDTFQLDYGQEDSVSDDLPKDSNTGDQQLRTITEDDSSREEGEISDEEEVPPPAPKPATPPPPPVARPRRPTPTSPQARKLALRIGDHKPSLLDRISTLATPIEPQAPSPSTPNLPARPKATWSPLQISSEQVRPNLHMNQVEFDKAKGLILDLLGYGVAPEYLVECGLSRECIYYGFQELNLRLPTNLNTTGLLPYAPDTIQNFTIIPSGPRIRPPPPTSTPAAAPLPPRIVAESTPGVDSPSDDAQGDLNDMERQRKEELMARRAVLASRRPKTQAKENQKIEFAPLPPSQITVDDFLKSITTPVVESKGTMPPFSPMDIDNKPNPPSDSPIEILTPIERAPPLITTINHLRTSPEPINGAWEGSSSRAPTPQYLRRGIKRPVASDFVDVDPRRPYPHDSSNTFNHPPVRSRTTPSFVNVRQTKCVIDLSDSESEDEDEQTQRPIAKAPSPGLPGTKAVDLSLKEKEREIQRMKELIARHEQKTLLKKLGLQAPPVTPSGPPTGASTPVVPDEPIMSASPTTTNMITSSSDTVPETPGTTATTSQPTTPFVDSPDTDVSMAAVQDESNANRSTLETQGEPHAHQVPEPINVDVKTSSQAQEPGSTPTITETPTTSHFPLYNSLFSSYPSLRDTVPSISKEETFDIDDRTASASCDDELSTLFSSKSASQPRALVSDLRSSPASAWVKLVDPNKQICQFEIPGGGICRDSNCEDIHLNQLGVAVRHGPDDEGTAR